MVGYRQPGLHAIVDDVGHVGPRVHQIDGPEETPQVHVPAHEQLSHEMAAGGGFGGAGDLVGLVGVARFSRRVQPPFAVLDPGGHVLDGVVEVFGHEARPPALEDQHAPAGPVLDQFMLAAIFEDLGFEVRIEGRLAPAEVEEVVRRRWIVVEDLVEVGLGVEPFALPSFDAEVAELLAEEPRPRRDGVGVAEARDRVGPAFARGQGVDAVLGGLGHWGRSDPYILVGGSPGPANSCSISRRGGSGDPPRLQLNPSSLPAAGLRRWRNR